MERQRKIGFAHVALLALTAAFLVSLAYLAARGGAPASPEGYSVAVEREVSEEALAPVGEPVNVNTAAAEELERLPGVGPALARAIIDYREAHGAFTSIDELTNVSGIGAAKLEGFRDDVTLGEEDAG